MAEITAALVKALRERTGAGMMDCKSALGECGGDMEVAVDWLRKNGLAAAAKKAGRAAKEGLVGVVTKGGRGALVEVNSETDFVARNDVFQKAVATITDLALEVGGDFEALKSAPYPGGSETVAETVTSLIATIGENIGLRRAAGFQVDAGVVASYVHGAIGTNLGRIGVLVALESSGDAAKLDALGHQIAMHVAAANPQALSVEDLDPTLVERERKVLAEQARVSGKPDEIIAKMVEGRLKKFYEEAVLLEQVFVIDGENRVGMVVEQAADEIGVPIKISGFVRFALGEGVEEAAEEG
jgi:elongation factor Ts